MVNGIVHRKKTIPNLKTKFIKKHGKKTYDGLFRIWSVLGTVTTTWGYSKAMMESEIKFFTKEAKNAGYPKDIIPEFLKYGCEMRKMGNIIVNRKAYTRKDGTRVKASSFKTKDKGAKGRTPKSNRWAEFNTSTGWSKSQPSDTRHRKMLSTTNKKLSLHDRYVQAGRRLVQLANVTTDKPTEIKARADAHYFFRKAKEDWYGKGKK